MATHHLKLIDIAVKAAKPGSVRREIQDGAVAGLHLIVQTSGIKSWALRYRSGGRARKLHRPLPGHRSSECAQARQAGCRRGHARQRSWRREDTGAPGGNRDRRAWAVDAFWNHRRRISRQAHPQEDAPRDAATGGRLIPTRVQSPGQAAHRHDRALRRASPLRRHHRSRATTRPRTERRATCP
jgi:hypothetical protein